MASERDFADWVLVFSQAAAGIGAAWAAWEARKSANASRDTSRDAEAALALAIAPKLVLADTSRTFDDSQKLTRTIELAFDSEHTASDLFLRVKYRDGRTESHERTSLGAEGWQIELNRTWQGEPDLQETGETATLIYKDKRGIATYELRGGFSHYPSSEREVPKSYGVFSGRPRIIQPPHMREG